MSARIYMNGRIVYTSRDYRPVGAPQQMELEKRLPIASVLPRVKEVGTPWYDDEDDVNYRIVEHLDPKVGWLLVSQVMRRYNITHAYAMRLAREGYIDPAMEQGSPTKRYRIRDDKKIREVCHAWKVKAGTISARKAKR